MLTTIKSEAIRLRRPSFIYGGLGLMVGFTALISIFAFSSATSSTEKMGRIGTSLGELEAVGGFVASLGQISSLVGIIALAFWAIAAATDYESGLVRVLVQAQPNRIKLISGKVGALVAFTVVGTLLSTVVAALLAWPLASAFGISTDAWTTGFATELFSAFANLTVAALVWGAVGLAIAVVTRSAGTAIAVGIGYLMVVENLIGIVAESATTYLPAGTLSAVASGGTADLAYLPALALAFGYGILALGSAATIFSRREVIS